MTENRYALAGWAAILSAAATLAVLGLSLVFELSKIVETHGRFTPTIWSLRQIVLVVCIDAVGWILGIYALVKFRDLLRERYDFHAIDHLVWIVIGAGVLAGAASYAHRAFGSGEFGGALAGMATMVVLGVLNGVIGIVFATRLLKINGNLNGYKKPLAYVYLAGSICFLLVVPALAGMVLLTAWSVLLGLTFFKGEDLEELEVV